MAVTIDPIHQFELKPLVSLGHIGHQQLAFTQSALYMFAAVGVIALITIVATASRSVVPGRMQSLAEIFYEFIADTVHQATGDGGKRFMPLVFSLFMFVLVLNLFGMIPYAFAVTSHLIITFGLAALVISTVVIFGVMKHGTHFFGLFVPSGVPKPLLAILVPIEVISFISRPISLSVRLFANMLAWPHRDEDLRLLRGSAPSRGRLERAIAAPAVPDDRADRSRVPRCGASGLRLRDADGDLPQRRPSPRPLIGRLHPPQTSSHVSI